MKDKYIKLCSDKSYSEVKENNFILASLPKSPQCEGLNETGQLKCTGTCDYNPGVCCFECDDKRCKIPQRITIGTRLKFSVLKDKYFGHEKNKNLSRASTKQ